MKAYCDESEYAGSSRCRWAASKETLNCDHLTFAHQLVEPLS